MNTNTVTISGRLTKNPEIKVTQSGKRLCGFTVAVNRQNDDVDFIDCIAFEKTAEIMEEYCEKGKRVVITGRLQTRTYEAKNGQKVKVVEVVADRVEIIDFKDRAEKPQPIAEDKKEEVDDDLEDSFPF
jgi:single-strand DNA-binding protein